MNNASSEHLVINLSSTNPLVSKFKKKQIKSVSPKAPLKVTDESNKSQVLSNNNPNNHYAGAEWNPLPLTK